MEIEALCVEELCSNMGDKLILMMHTENRTVFVYGCLYIDIMLYTGSYSEVFQSLDPDFINPNTSAIKFYKCWSSSVKDRKEVL